MNYNRLYIISIFLILASSALASASHPQRSMYDYDFIRAANPWLTSFNAAGLGTLQVDRTSFAQASFTKENGGLIPVEGSDDSWKAGAETGSYVKISDRIAFHGELAYSYFHGDHMSGHYFIDPSYNPINLLESDSSNSGVKIKETYNLVGAISYSFSKKWALGADIKYETADYAKRKDPRPRSRWMDLDITFGAKFSPSESFALGLNLEYVRTIEILDGDSFGTTDRQYFTLVDYGGYLGYNEAFEGSNGYVNVGTTTTGYARPMANAFYGGSLQLAFGQLDKTLFYNELTYLRRAGQYGNRASTQVTYSEHDGNIFGYSGILNIYRAGAMHRIEFEAGYETLNNYENVYTKTTEKGGNTLVDYLGSWQTLDRQDIKGRLTYSGYLGIDQNRPKWEYMADVSGISRSFTSVYYPYWRSQTVTSLNGHLSGKRNIIVKNNIFAVGLGLGFFTGFGTKNTDGNYGATASDNRISADDYLNRDFEYDTLSRVSASLSLRYTRLFKNNLSVYAEISDGYCHTLGAPEFLPSGYRNILTVTFGFYF